MLITVEGVRPYDGSYSLAFFGDDLTTREWGWVKRLSGYLPLAMEQAVDDPEFGCVLAAIAMRRAGKIEARELPEVFERLIDAPFGSAITINTEPGDDEPEAADAGPPEQSSNGSEITSGPALKTNSETSEAETLHGSGTRGSASSESDLPTWES